MAHRKQHSRELSSLQGTLGKYHKEPTSSVRARANIDYNKSSTDGTRRSTSHDTNTNTPEKMQRKNRVSKRDQGTGEEVQLWARAQDMLADIVKNVNEDNDRVAQLVKDDKELGAMNDDDIPLDRIQSMDDLCRQGVKGSENTTSAIKAAIEQLNVLRAIAVAKEQSEAPPTTTLGKRSTATRDRADRNADRASKDKEKEKIKEDTPSAATASSVYDIDAIADSPANSPAPISSSSRKFSERASNRDRDSMPPKADSAEPQGTSVGPSGSANGSASSGTTAAAAALAAAAANRSRVIFSKGDAVAFKPKSISGEQSSDWILGEVAQVMGEGKSRRYKVLDVEPEDHATKREYRSSASSMIPITPEEDAGTLPDWEAGKVVLALYPNTTTFYRADVYSMDTDGRVNLKFEGENDSTTLQQVDRRFVIEYRL